MNTVPDHVRAAFHAESGEALPLGYAWDYGFRVGSIVLSPILDPDNAAWSSKVREQLHVDGLRVARPVRATDGRFIVSGWKATNFGAGELASGRVDEVVLAGLRLADALADVPAPEFATAPVTGPWSREDVFRVADKAAWSDDPAELLALGMDLEATATPQLEAALVLAARISKLIPEIEAPSHVGHADMLTTTLFSGTQPPFVTDIVATVRPHGYTAALAAVDGMLFDATDSGIMGRFAHVPDFTALLMRALLYRVFVAALTDDGADDLAERLEKVADTLINF